jgi:hypothetical protein
MAPPSVPEVLRFCLFGAGRRSAFDRVAIVVTWCLALAVFFFNALFPLLFSDGNLFIRGAGTLILSAPLLGLYLRGKRSLLARRTIT